MRFSLFFVLSYVASLNYTPGESFSYKYSSNYVNAAVKDEEQEQQIISLSCDVSFTVQQVTSKGAYIQLSVNNVESEITDGEESEKGQNDEEIEELYSLPLYFTQLPDGSIEGVAAHEDETEEVLQTKVGILYSLRSSILEQPSSEFVEVSVTDTHGIHNEFVEATESDGEMIYSSHYTEDDFDEFADENLSKNEISIEVANQRVVSNDRIVSSSSQTTLVLNKPTYDEPTDDSEYEDADVSYVVWGEATLSEYTQSNGFFDEDDLLAFTCAEEHVTSNPSYRLVDYYNREALENRYIPVKLEVSEPVEVASCPSGVNVCKSYSKSKSAGNNNIGISISASFVAGVHKGCASSTRSYMLGAYASLSLKVLSKSISAAYGSAEYGIVNGKAYNNKIQLKVFGVSVYSRGLPNQDCVSRSVSLISVSKKFSFSYKVVVYVVPVTFSVGASVGFSTTLKFSACPSSLTASIQLVPKVTGTVYAQASASVAAARAGITLSCSVGDYLDPKAYVSASTCRIGVSMSNTLSPIKGTFTGWWQVRTVTKGKVSWGTKHSKTFWSHSWGGSSQKLLDTYVSAK